MPILMVNSLDVSVRISADKISILIGRLKKIAFTDVSGHHPIIPLGFE